MLKSTPCVLCTIQYYWRICLFSDPDKNVSLKRYSRSSRLQESRICRIFSGLIRFSPVVHARAAGATAALPQQANGANCALIQRDNREFQIDAVPLPPSTHLFTPASIQGQSAALLLPSPVATTHSAASARPQPLPLPPTPRIRSNIIRNRFCWDRKPSPFSDPRQIKVGRWEFQDSEIQKYSARLQADFLEGEFQERKQQLIQNSKLE